MAFCFGGSETYCSQEKETGGVLTSLIVSIDLIDRGLWILERATVTHLELALGTVSFLLSFLELLLRGLHKVEINQAERIRNILMYIS